LQGAAPPRRAASCILPAVEAPDVITLGGGAAGLFFAATAGARGRRVLVLDHAPRPGAKILISGGGRCNFTNLHTAPGHFRSANPDFARSALARFPPAAFVALVDRHRIPWHEKQDGQAFCDRSARDILDMLRAECHAAGVEMRAGCPVKGVTRVDGGFRVTTAKGAFTAPALVVATGGLSVPGTGASPFGYRVAERFGLPIVPPRAALVPFTLGEAERAWTAPLSGVSCPAAVTAGGRTVPGPVLFTHRGLSGPAVLTASLWWEPGAPVTVNLLPDGDGAAWLDGQRRAHPRALLKTTLAARFPRRLAEAVCRHVAGVEGGRRLAEVPVARVAERLAAWTFTPAGTEGYRTAEVTAGGVDARALSSRTMEAREVPGLYFIGEVVDVTGELGGFNFQWAWASARAAGEAV
jgi:predicted Rossmann fold flavoprotein